MLVAAIIELRKLSFYYREKLILDDISLTVERGDFLGLTGPNGSGKTTLIKVLIGLLKPFKGDVLLFGVPIRSFRDWFRIGYIPQKAVFESCFPATVEEIVAMGRYGRLGLGKPLSRKDRRAIAEALEVTGISSLHRQPVNQLSGGQQQRVFIARALAGEPELLVLDEPQVGLDVSASKSLYLLLKQLNENKKITLVMVFHDPDAEHWVKRIAYLNRTLACSPGSGPDLKQDFSLGTRSLKKEGDFPAGDVQLRVHGTCS